MKHVTDQPYLDPALAPPTEPKIPAIDDALDDWLESGVDLKRAADTKKLKHASLSELIRDHKLERYPYVERSTGKKRYVYPHVETKLRTSAAPKPPKQRKRKESDDETEPKADDKVEMRRVSRRSVEKEIGPLDPFAATREKMGSLLDDDETPAPSKPKKRSKKSRRS